MENTRGILLMVLAMFAFATSDSFIKAATGTIFTTGQIILLLGFIVTPVFAVLCIYKKQTPFTLSFFAPPVLLRNLGEMMGTFGIITSLSVTSISTTSSIHQATPLAVTMGAALILGETVGWRRWSAIFFGFLCILLIIRPGLDGFDKNALFAVFGVLGFSLRDLATRRIKSSVSTLQLSVWGYLILIPLGLGLITLDGSVAIPLQNAYGLTAIAFMVCIAAFSMLANFSITTAVRLGQLSVIFPFHYTRLIFSLIYGYMLFGDRPDWQTLIGAAGIIGSGIFLMIREHNTRTLPSCPASR